MKFEEYWKNGQYYKTRDGRKVRIYALDGQGCSPIQGAISYIEAGWYSYSWKHNGMVLKSGDECSTDIVGYWEEVVSNIVPSNIDEVCHVDEAYTIDGVSLQPGNEIKLLFEKGILSYDLEFKYTDKYKCDCGAEKAHTTHSHWCSVNKKEIT